MIMINKLKEAVKTPQFKGEWELTEEQLTDPDYRLKQIAKRAGLKETDIINCTKCHHCR